MALISSHPEQEERLCSIDVFRGLVMLLLLSGTYTQFREGFGVGRIAEAYPDSFVGQLLSAQFTHTAWVGCTLWDLIMPAFIFMVGVSMSFSCARRRRQGHSELALAAHALIRAMILVGLGSVGFIWLGNLAMLKFPSHINADFSNVLSQIGLGYFFAFLLVGKGLRTQLIWAAGILFVYWLAFALYPISDKDFRVAADALHKHAGQLEGFYAHWNRDANLAADFDRWFLNIIPRTDMYVSNSAGMQTLNFIPTIATIIFGIAAGDGLKLVGDRSESVRFLTIAGFIAVIGGLALGATFCPLVKALWTPSWTIFSGGTSVILLALFYWIIEVNEWRRWAFPFVVLGMNSLVAYSLANIADYWIWKVWEKALGKGLFVGSYGSLWKSLVAIASIWGVCFLLYRRETFVRV